MRRGLALRHIVQRELIRGHTTPENKSAVPIVGTSVVVGLHEHADRREGFVALTRDMEMSLALAVEVFLAQVSVTALENRQKQFALNLGRERSDFGHGVYAASLGWGETQQVVLLLKTNPRSLIFATVFV